MLFLYAYEVDKYLINILLNPAYFMWAAQLVITFYNIVQ